jgi:hypothetical protein
VIPANDNTGREVATDAYRAECEAIRDSLNAIGSVLIVIEGERGTDLSVSVPDEMRPFLPDLLRRLALREEARGLRDCAPALLCPVCVRSRFVREQNDGRMPAPGDYVVCSVCASFLRVLLELHEVGEMPDSTRIQLCTIRESIQAGHVTKAIDL